MEVVIFRTLVEALHFRAHGNGPRIALGNTCLVVRHQVAVLARPTQTHVVAVPRLEPVALGPRNAPASRPVQRAVVVADALPELTRGYLGRSCDNLLLILSTAGHAFVTNDVQIGLAEAPLETRVLDRDCVLVGAALSQTAPVVRGEVRRAATDSILFITGCVDTRALYHAVLLVRRRVTVNVIFYFVNVLRSTLLERQQRLVLHIQYFVVREVGV